MLPIVQALDESYTFIIKQINLDYVICKIDLNITNTKVNFNQFNYLIESINLKNFTKVTQDTFFFKIRNIIMRNNDVEIIEEKGIDIDYQFKSSTENIITFKSTDIKIKLTPFQKYQRYKTKKALTTEKQINNSKTILYNYPINNRIRKNNPDLFTINNTYIKRMRKNKTNQNNQFYHTHHNFFFKPKKKLILQPNQLTEPNVYQTINNNNIKFNPRSKSNYQTINIHKTNKIIQTNESNKKIGDKVNTTFEQFPILDVFNSKSKINDNWIKNKLKKEREERKKRIPFVNINKAKFSNILLNY